MRYIRLGKTLPYLTLRLLLSLKDLSIYIIYPIVLSVGLPIYILTLYKIFCLLSNYISVRYIT